MRSNRVVVAILAVLMSAACRPNTRSPTSGPNPLYPDGGPNPGGTLAGLKSLQLSPDNAALAVTGNASASQLFTLMGTYEDGHTADLSTQVPLTATPTSLGSFAGPTFVASGNRGGVVTVSASVNGVSTSTNLTLQLQTSASDPRSTDLPSSPGSYFQGSDDSTQALTLLYPNDGVLFPPNLNQMEFHFRPVAGQTVFQLDFENGVTRSQIYFTCTNFGLNGGCAYTPDSAFWQMVSATNRGGGQVQVTLRGSGSTAKFGSSPPIHIQFAPDDMLGALYYWSTTTTSVMRYDFSQGSSGNTAEVFLQGVGNPMTNNACVGCHALSRDGSKMVAELGGQKNGSTLILDVATQKLLSGTSITPKYTSIFESWNPDGSQYVGVYDDTADAVTDNLILFDGQTGHKTGEIAGTGTTNNPADHPDWSPDGTRIAFTSVGIKGTAGTEQRSWQGAIHMVTQSNGVWQPPVEIVPAVPGKNHYYPAFSPDNSMLAFDESTCPPNAPTDFTCNFDTDPTATLYMVAPSTGATPIQLANANRGGPGDASPNLTNSFPKWSPFVSTGVSGAGSQLMWMTFSSTRAYGLRTPPAATTKLQPQGIGENVSGTLLWMTAIDPAKFHAGQDPSYPAFALPIQNLATSNHIGQWTKATPNTCGAVGDTCTAASPCCNGLSCVDENFNVCSPQTSGEDVCTCQPEIN